MSIKTLKKRLFTLCIDVKAFSLLELLITLGIFAILLAIISNIIVINLKVSRRIQARTKVREETSFLLKNLKKDIRNAEAVEKISDQELRVEVIPAMGSGVENRCWFYDKSAPSPEDWYVGREVCDPDCSTNCETDFRTPGDIEINYFKFDAREYGPRNTIVLIGLKARTQGMPDDQYVAKEIAVSTRNIGFE